MPFGGAFTGPCQAPLELPVPLGDGFLQRHTLFRTCRSGHRKLVSSRPTLDDMSQYGRVREDGPVLLCGIQRCRPSG